MYLPSFFLLKSIVLATEVPVGLLMLIIHFHAVLENILTNFFFFFFVVEWKIDLADYWD